MAVIQYSALVSQMRGKFNGSVLSKFRTGFNAYNRGLPRITPTHTQLSRRSGFTTNANNWKSLSPADRQAWNDLAQTYQVSNRIGELTNLSGYAYFMKVQQFCHHNGIDTPIPPDAGNTGTLELEFTVDGLEFEVLDEGFSITLLWLKLVTSTNAPSGTYVNISISNPLTPSQEVYTGTYYFVGQYVLSALPAPPFNAEMDFTNVVMPVGWYSFDGARHRVRYQSVNPYTGQRAVTKYNDGISQEVIPAPFPPWELWVDSLVYYVSPTAGEYRIAAQFYEGLPNPSAFRWQMQFGGTAPAGQMPDPQIWYPLTTSGLVYIPATAMYGPAVPGTTNGWFDAWLADVEPLFDAGVDIFSAVRIRLERISDGAVEPWRDFILRIYY